MTATSRLTTPRAWPGHLRSLIMAYSPAILLWTLAGCSQQVQPSTLAGANAIRGAEPEASGIEMCGTLKLPGHWPGTDISLGGLSAAGWDNDEQVLYLVSDRGRLHVTRPVFDGDKLTDLEMLDSAPLLDTHGNPLRGKDVDAESLVVLHANDGTPGNSELLVGFEQDHRLQSFMPDGQPVGDPLRPQGVQGASANAAMEALAEIPGLGIIAGLESPPEGADDKVTRLFTIDDQQQWHYPLSSAVGSALTDMAPLPTRPEEPPAALMLERAYAPPHPLVISLSKAELLAPPNTRVTRITRLSSSEGWRLDNMEGLAALPNSRFLMVSDDNFSVLQRSLVTCFRLAGS